ncbi:MAG: DUF262 domain-containing protein [Dictyoglomus thermophilum]|nr:DUF262 domain-containing protein [Dictyoglomus thermophilum]MCX7720656.1 DUF262 domain-containing protein [Dictyoglomus thermophilum]
MIQKFVVNQVSVNIILSWISSGEIAIPEIQRPFVWDSTQVRDFIDSLYRGYPVGYLIVWQNPNIRDKSGNLTKGKKILIDGQQRVISLMTAILGKEILDRNYKKRRIIIAFNPLEEKFEVQNASIVKDKSWIPDISVLFSQNFKTLDFIKEFSSINNVDEHKILEIIESLKAIINIPIGLIELSSELDIDEVTEIFIRINSKGVPLNQADFAMSKIAVDEKYGGNVLRKAIDYFCFLSVRPNAFEQIKNDKEFSATDYFKRMSWLKNDKGDIYAPSYADMLRVAFTYKFKRGRMQDLVALLSGRDFQTKQYKEEIIEESLIKLREGILDYMNEHNFKKFVMILRSAGFIDSSIMISQNAINFAYILYLTLKERGIHQGIIESLVRKWYVFSVLTSRYSGSPEAQFDFDIRRIEQNNPIEFLENVLKSELSDSFWNITLPQQMDTAALRSPIFHVFLAAQVKMEDKGFLSKDIKVADLIKIKGDIHHIFPREYLKRIGFIDKDEYNQIANLVMAQSEINIAIGNKSPESYFKELLEQCETKRLKYGAIVNKDELFENLRMHCIPFEIFGELSKDYNAFLIERRKLMAKKIKEYFDKL